MPFIKRLAVYDDRHLSLLTLTGLFSVAWRHEVRTAWIKSVVGRGGDIFDGKQEKLLPLVEGALYRPLDSNPANAAVSNFWQWRLCCVRTPCLVEHTSWLPRTYRPALNFGHRLLNIGNPCLSNYTTNMRFKSHMHSLTVYNVSKLRQIGVPSPAISDVLSTKTMILGLTG
jgi:hypothetical protein